METIDKRIALFTGTFDPFTIGHESRWFGGLQLMDEIVIAIGVNESKKSYFTLEERLEMIRDLYRDEPRVRVESYESLTIDFARGRTASSCGASVRCSTSSMKKPLPT